MGKQGYLFIILGFMAVFSLAAQIHVSVPLDSGVYPILEQAEIRGLCKPLPGAKPYSRAVVLNAIKEILQSDENQRLGKLSKSERLILENVKKQYGNNEEKGFDWARGFYRFQHNKVDEKLYFSANLGLRAETVFSGGFYPGGGTDVALAHTVVAAIDFMGDAGAHFSYHIPLSGFIVRSPRAVLGTYNTYHDGFVYDSTDPGRKDEEIKTYSEPLAYFPYTYKKPWDGFMWNIEKVDNSSMIAWPQDYSVGYGMKPELGGAFLSDHVTYRFGRIDREWGGMSNGNSLILNKQAQPFLALEATATPFKWLGLSVLTGVLEYYNAKGLKESAATFQNAFSMGMVEVNIKNYFHADFGSTVIWPKRFELGYLFPLFDNFLYQNNIGDFDNLAFFVNLKGQYPGIGNIWVSLFLDELPFEKELFILDRAMFAYQAGTTIALPFLPFGSLSLSYTKIEPYVYSHTKEIVPWYGDTPMESSYTNNGRSLGFYLPPNSDELKLRFEAMPEINTRVNLQYQMIRHGADFGSRAVDGSSYLSELDPRGRSEKPQLKKFFLQDGAYQWLHIIKVGAEHTFAIKKAPVFQIFGETGVVISSFTDIAGPANSGSPSSYSVIDTSEYPKSTGFILTVGFRIYPQ
ncbi:hypothetical protein FACS1894110_17550 [Spirochaetia bacterium]|nr:hypothetical protein FACS1894110_17550 [Spirochaetia bacterium]